MTPHTILATLNRLAQPHLSGHRCIDGKWYNPNAGARQPCPESYAMAGLVLDVQALHASVRESAEPAAVAVAEGMTGLTMADLGDEEREGWTLTGQRAIEALADWLDAAPEREERATAALSRIHRTTT